MRAFEAEAAEATRNMSTGLRDPSTHLLDDDRVHAAAKTSLGQGRKPLSSAQPPEREPAAADGPWPRTSREELLQTLTYVGVPLIAMIGTSVMFPGGVPRGTSSWVANGVGVAMVAGRAHTVASRWGELGEAGDTATAVLIKQVAMLFTLLGAVARTAGAAHDGNQHFWACNRLLGAFNALILVVSGVMLRCCGTSAYLPGKVSFAHSMFVACGLLLQALTFDECVRRRLAALVSTTLGDARKIAVAT